MSEEKPEDKTYVVANVETVADIVARFYWTLLKRGVQKDHALQLTIAWISTTLSAKVIE